MTTLIEVRTQSDKETLERLIEKAIRSQTGGLVRGLAVTGENDQLILTGCVERYYHKQLATQAAMEFSGQLDLVNNIEVCSR